MNRKRKHRIGPWMGGVVAIVLTGWIMASSALVSPPNRTMEAGEEGPVATDEYDAIVVGAGLSGLTTALELGRAGRRVAVVDMASVFGGHAVMANGDLNIVNTPMQKLRGIDDSPERAMADILHWGESGETEWVKYYAEHSGAEIYDWLTDLGIEFWDILQGPGDSVPRVHLTEGRGIGLVSPVYRECLAYPNITFLWNNRVTRLETNRERVSGIVMTNLRTGVNAKLHAPAVVLATGGFQSNLEMVRQYWAEGLPFPERFLAGSGIHSVGEGHRLAEESGGALVGMERQMNLSSGIVDPRYPDGYRGLNAGHKQSVWINGEGMRFVDERTKASKALPVVLEQPGMSYWAIFDEKTRDGFRVSGSDWTTFSRIDTLILQNPKITKVANSWKELAAQTGLPPVALQTTMERYNTMIAAGLDTDFARFGGDTLPLSAVQTPPFYAVQFFPLTRKSMGGVKIDLSCRVLDVRAQVIPGLYAVGELTGSAGINGRSGMAGMFLGPCVLMGQVASRAVLADLGPADRNSELAKTFESEFGARSTSAHTAQCLQCHALPQLVGENREGFWHFEQVHHQVLQRGNDCADCHSEVAPAVMGDTHRIIPRRLAQSCVACHIAIE